MTYKDAGVDKEKGYEHVRAIKDNLKQTHDNHVMNMIGGFAGMYALPTEYENPVLVSGTDGIGTKVKLATYFDTYDTVGIDCVAMCVNDILCHGAKPLFFLDYLAMGHLNTKVSTDLVAGIVQGCLQSETSLIGGETAEMPGVYDDGDFDMAGFAVGLVDKKDIIDGSAIKKGDIIIGIPSSGLHSNGFSLVRHILNTDTLLHEHKEDLLTPTRIYVKDILGLLKEVRPHGLAHITGGGLIENLPRILPKGCHALVDKRAIQVPSIMKTLQTLAQLDENEMFGTFNMGVGFVVVVDAADVDVTLNHLKDAYVIGQIVEGEIGITL